MADITTTQQIVREAPEIEEYKKRLLEQAENLALNVQVQRDPNTGQPVIDAATGRPKLVPSTTLAQQLPQYQVAGFSDAQASAIRAAEAQGVGGYSPYMTAANQALSGGLSTTAEAADVLRGADTRAQFTDAQTAMQQAGGAAAGISGGLGQIAQATGFTVPEVLDAQGNVTQAARYVPGSMDVAQQRALASDTTARFTPAFQDINSGIGALATAQNLAGASSAANLAPATAAIGQGLTGLTEAQRMATGAAGADFSGSQGILQRAALATEAAVPQFGAAQQAVTGGIGQAATAAQQAAAAAQQPGFTQQGQYLDLAALSAAGAGPSDFAAAQRRLTGAATTGQQAADAAALAAAQPGFGQAGLQGQQAVQMAQQAAAQPGFARGTEALFGGAEQAAAAAQQPGFGQGIASALTAAEQARMAAAQPGFAAAQATGMEAARAAQAAATQPGLQGGVDTQMAAAQQAAAAAQQPGFAAAQQAIQQGIGQLGGAAQAFDPTSAQAFMNP